MRTFVFKEKAVQALVFVLLKLVELFLIIILPVLASKNSFVERFINQTGLKTLLESNSILCHWFAGLFFIFFFACTVAMFGLLLFGGVYIVSKFFIFNWHLAEEILFWVRIKMMRRRKT